MTTTSQAQTRLGIGMGLFAYVAWGLLPLYLRALLPVAATSILAHRIVWSVLVLSGLAWAMKRWPGAIAAIRQPRIALAMLASTCLIAVNWLIYIVAVNSGHTLQASLGYFMNPLVNVLLGVVILRERLGKPEIVAILLAAAGVASLAIAQGAIPVIPLALAVSFSLYGLVRKITPVGPIEGLLIETSILTPLALGWLLTVPTLPADGSGPPYWLLMAGGIVTTLPLLMFAAATKRLRYSDLGLLQYVSPTLQLLLAVWVFGEPLLPIHKLAFALIWAGLLIYAIATWRRGRGDAPLPE